MMPLSRRRAAEQGILPAAERGAACAAVDQAAARLPAMALPLKKRRRGLTRRPQWRRCPERCTNGVLPMRLGNAAAAILLLRAQGLRRRGHRVVPTRAAHQVYTVPSSGLGGAMCVLALLRAPAGTGPPGRQTGEVAKRRSGQVPELGADLPEPAGSTLLWLTEVT